MYLEIVHSSADNPIAIIKYADHVQLDAQEITACVYTFELLIFPPILLDVYPSMSSTDSLYIS